MRKRSVLGLVLAAFLAAPAARVEGDGKKGLSLSLTALPRVANAPISVLFRVKLTGGEDSEAFYCPILEWDWGDGTQSTNGGECPAFVAGETKIDRFFEAEHEYRREARPTVRLILSKDDKSLGQTNVTLVIGSPRKKTSLTVESQ